MYPALHLKKDRDYSVRRGHPWVFSGGVSRVEGQADEGSCVKVTSADGAVLGLAHVSHIGSIRARMLGFRSGERAEEDLVSELLQSAVALRTQEGLPESEGPFATSAYRVVHGEGDGLPGLVVDRFGSVLVVQPHTFAMFRLREFVAATLERLFSGEIDTIFCRAQSTLPGERMDRHADHFLKGSTDQTEVRVNGARFMVDFVHGQKTGFFLDQRFNHRVVRGLSKGKDVLNCFCYTGAFTVSAGLGSATSLMSVDRSADALRLCEEHLALNAVTAPHEAIQSDVQEFLERDNRMFDVVIIDPPAFIKHKEALQQGMKGYRALHRAAVRRIRPGGLLVTFSCSQLLSEEDFSSVIAQSLGEEGKNGQVLQLLHQAPCHPVRMTHPEGRYLKGKVLRVL